MIGNNKFRKLIPWFSLCLLIIMLTFVPGAEIPFSNTIFASTFQKINIEEYLPEEDPQTLNSAYMSGEIVLRDDFSEGLGIFSKSDNSEDKITRGFTTKDSKIFLETESKAESNKFSEGYSMFWGSLNEGDGFIDKRGQKLDFFPSFYYYDYPLDRTKVPWIDRGSRWDKKTAAFSEGLAAVKIDSAWGLVSKQGKIVAQPRFDMAAAPSEGLAPVKLNDLWGFVDTTGEIVIEPQFEDARRKLTDEYIFSEGRALIMSEGKFGYINPFGEMVIGAVFRDGRAFSEGLAPVQLDNHKYGYIDALGNRVIEPRFDTAASFSEGLALVSTESKFGYIDGTGHFVIEPQFDGGQNFSEGLAPFFLDGEWGYIDTMGSVAAEPQFRTANGFSEGVAQACPAISGTPCFALHKRDLIP